MQYDGTGKLGGAIAELYGLSPKSSAQISGRIGQARVALNITSKAKNLPDEVKLAIYRWHYERLNADNAVQADMLGEPLDDTPINDIETLADVVAVQDKPESEADTYTADTGDFSGNDASAVIIDTGEASSGSPTSLEPLPPLKIDDASMAAIGSTVTAIDAQPTPAPTEPQRSSNWGGVRQGSGRKATGKQTVTMRVPVELAGIIKQLKGIGGTQGQAALLEVVSGFEIALQNSRHMPKA